MTYNKNKKRSHKNKSQKRRKNRTSMKKSMKGGGDFFISKSEPASFSDVPLKSFYTMNRLNEGTDVQHMQQSARLTGGKKNRKTQKNLKSQKSQKNKNRQRGGGLLDSVSRLMTPSNPNVVSDSGNINGLPTQARILAGAGVPSNGPFPVKINTNSYLV